MSSHVLQIFKNYVLELGFPIGYEHADYFWFQGQRENVVVYLYKNGFVNVFTYTINCGPMEDWGLAKQRIFEYAFI